MYGSMTVAASGPTIRLLLRFRDVSRRCGRGRRLPDLKEVMLVGPSIVWLYIAPRRVTVVTRVWTRSQLALQIAS